MFKKSFLMLIMVLLLASCKNPNNTDIPIDEPEIITPDDDKEPEGLRYTGEIISDGLYGNKGRIYFVPDKETRELLKNEYPYPINAGESIPLDYDDINIVKDLPRELGIIKVEIEANFKTGNIFSKLKSVKLTEKIGTIEYEGKQYPTNELDETVTAKDKVCGLIVSNVRRIDEGVLIEFEGEIESEGFYNVHNGGEFYNYINIGRIVPDEKSLKNFPTYKGVGNKWSVYFTETNELYKQLANHSAVGRGKFKSTNYHIVYNYGGGVPPREILTEIISLDEKYKGLFEFKDSVTVTTLVNESNKYKDGFMDKYAIVYEKRIFDNNQFENNYYFLGKKEISKIKIHTSNEFYYWLKENNSDDVNSFELITDTDGKKPHSISFRYFGKESTSSGTDLILKKCDYGMFKDGESVIKVYEGDKILGMTAEDINIEYHCTEENPEKLVRIISQFSGEITLTGKLTLYYDEAMGNNRIFFSADDESIKKLPIHIEDTRGQGSMIFTNENLEKMLGNEPFEKNAEITIKSYRIHYAETETYNSAELMSVNFLE